MINTRKMKARLVELGLSQKDFAECLGIATATANQKINNVRPMSLKEAEKICKLLNIEPEQFASYLFAQEIA